MTIHETHIPMIETLLDDIGHGSRDIWENMTQGEKTLALSILQDLKDDGESSNLDALWELDYTEKPVDIDTFIDHPHYFGVPTQNRDGVPGAAIWPAWRKILREICHGGKEYYEVIFTGAIGTGKSSIGSVLLSYDFYKNLCLKEPQSFYGKMAGRSMVFGLFNLTFELARNIVYIPFRRQLGMSPWFKTVLREDKMKKGYISVAEDKIRVALGSQSIHALGADVAGAFLDEANFRAPSKDVNEVAEVYLALSRRIQSRYMETGMPLPAHLIMVSSKMYSTSFLEQHINDKRSDPNVYVSELALYDAKPPETYSGVTFPVLIGDQHVESRMLDEDEVIDSRHYRIENVPIEFKTEFDRDLERAIQDICGVSTFLHGSLIPYPKRIQDIIDPDRRHPFTRHTPHIGLTDPTPIQSFLRLEDLVVKTPKKWVPKVYPKGFRYIHCDLSKTGDRTGIAMGCRGEPKIVERLDPYSGEIVEVKMPTVYYDFYVGLKPMAGSRMDYSKVAAFVLFLRDLGFRIRKVTTDQYQSQHLQQILEKYRFEVEEFSVDREDRPYLVLRDAILDNRVMGYDYPLVTDLNDGELVHLVHDTDKRKVDHDFEGSKDVADCMAAVAHHVIGGETIEAENELAESAFDIMRRMDEVLRTPKPKLPRREEEGSWILDDYQY